MTGFILQVLREEVEEKFNDGVFTWDDRRPHDCAALLKQFLRLNSLPFQLLLGVLSWLKF